MQCTSFLDLTPAGSVLHAAPEHMRVGRASPPTAAAVDVSQRQKVFYSKKAWLWPVPSSSPSDALLVRRALPAGSAGPPPARSCASDCVGDRKYAYGEYRAKFETREVYTSAYFSICRHSWDLSFRPARDR